VVCVHDTHEAGDQSHGKKEEQQQQKKKRLKDQQAMLRTMLLELKKR